MSIESRLDKLEEDNYRGRGPNNPSITSRLAVLEGDMTEVQQGVANFHNFQLTATKRLGFLQGAAWFAGIVGIILMALLGWALTLIIPAAKLVIEDYYHNHPAAKISQSEPQNASLKMGNLAF